MTDGILLAEIQRDRMLRRYDTLIVDEAHERSLNIDFILGYLRQLLPQRPDLSVVVTSATIDTARFASHFASDGVDAPVIEVTGRTFPVEVRYRPTVGDDRDQVQAIVDAVAELERRGPGDVLVFLSGEREIHDTADALRRLERPDTEVLPLYARLSSAEQHRIFQPHRGRRIVLSTNVAETSLTVPGVRFVVDAGTARISRYSRRLKVQRLPIEPVSQASAEPARRAVRPRRPGDVHPPVQRGGLRGPAGVHRTGDPAHQPGVGHPADDGDRSRRRRRLPVRRTAGCRCGARRLPAARGAGGDRCRRRRRRPPADADRQTPRPTAGRPASRPHGPRGRPPRLRARGSRHRRRTVDPGSARAARSTSAPRPTRPTAGSTSPGRTCCRSSPCGTTCAPSSGPARPTSSASCAAPSTSTTCVFGSGRTCSASCAASPATSEFVPARGVGRTTRPAIPITSTRLCSPDCCRTSGSAIATLGSSAARAARPSSSLPARCWPRSRRGG